MKGSLVNSALNEQSASVLNQSSVEQPSFDQTSQNRKLPLCIDTPNLTTACPTHRSILRTTREERARPTVALLQPTKRVVFDLTVYVRP